MQIINTYKIQFILHNKLWRVITLLVNYGADFFTMIPKFFSCLFLFNEELIIGKVFNVFERNKFCGNSLNMEKYSGKNQVENVKYLEVGIWLSHVTIYIFCQSSITNIQKFLYFQPWTCKAIKIFRLDSQWEKTVE